jgi:CubicO group peptidase (beta-lactamase class C family)
MMPRTRAIRMLTLVLLLAPLLTTTPIRAQDAATPPDGDTYNDPAGRFSMPIPQSWVVEEQNDFVLLHAPDGDLTIAALVVASEDAGAGIITAWKLVDPTFDPSASTPDRTEIPSDPGVDQTVVLTYDLGQSSGRVAQGLGQRVGNEVYVLIFLGDLETVVRRQSQINVIVTGFRILDLAQTDLSGRAVLPLTGDRLHEFETFVTDSLAKFGVPGASIVVVHGGQIVYAQGFGVAGPGGDQPVTPDTLMMIGSATKSFTTMLMATLIDEGRLTWDEPVVQILPTFRVSDSALTPMVTMRHLVCACTGVPRRDAELFFNANELTAEDVITSLADFPFYTAPGEAFQYSNQMVATGGYITVLTDGGQYGRLDDAYRSAVQERILVPIGMPRSTFDLVTVAADGDHALPHGLTLDGTYEAMPLSIESLTTPIDPSAGLWSSANEMARYVITQLRHGTSPNGTQVVSAESLEETWTPQVAVSDSTSYGLGWFIEDWQGLRIIRHGGNTRGFTSDVAFIPDADIGIVVLTNAQDANVVTAGIRQRLFELVYDQPGAIESQFSAAVEDAKQARAQMLAQLGDPLDSVQAGVLTGEYANAALGPVTVEFVDGALVADTGEFRVALQPLRILPPDGPAFVVADPPFAGLPVQFDTSGTAPRLIYGAAPEEYTFDLLPSPPTPVPSPVGLARDPNASLPVVPP